MKYNWKRMLALVLAFAMCMSLMPALQIHADEGDETTGTASSSYEPWAHGYRFVDVLNFDPATDPYAQELVASVPLQQRIPTFAATQANPNLSDKSKLYVISSGNYRSTDVNEAPWNANMSYDEFSYNLFKFWQYTDMVGSGGRPTTGILRGANDKEYGILAIPMAAATNAAHKNGAISLAEYFIPRTPQYTEEWLYKDENGNFPYAQKMLDIMHYYGFDGFFINQEEAIPAAYVPVLQEVLAWMVSQGAYIQWYDSITTGGSISYQNAFNSTNSPWVYNDTYGRVSNSIFLNYWYSSSALKNSKAHAESLGLDPYEVVYMGVEGGQWMFSRDIGTQHNAVDADGQPYTSFAIWGSDWYHEQFNKPFGRYQEQYQWEAETRERMYYTSPTENVLDHTNGFTRDDIGYTDPLNFKGFSTYVVEKSVIDGTTFATDFNNGHGVQYFRNGQVARNMEWTNLNLQDILPTWQWWIKSTDENQVKIDWDYGTEYERTQGAFPFTQIGAYNGGSSLVIYGGLQGSQTVNLYKTSMDVTATSTLALTYNKPCADDTSKIQVALIFEDAPETTVYLPVADSGKQTSGWNTVTVDLSEHAGRKLAAFGLELSAEEKVDAYQLNLGRIVITDGANHTPAAPTGLTLLKRFDNTNEVQIGWDLATYGETVNYHVSAVYADGTERFVGGAFASNYYIQTLENPENVVALRVRAVGIDGTESEPAELALAKTNRVSGVVTVSENNTLTVCWTEPEAEFESVEVAMGYWYSTKTAPEAVTVAKGVKTASFQVPCEDGSEYLLCVTTVNADGTRNETVNYYGVVADTYCAPYAGTARVNSSGKINLTAPEPEDWVTADITHAGQTTTYKRFGGSALKNLTVNATGVDTLVVTLTDRNGNTSAATTLLFVDGKPASAEAAFGEEIIPDPVLRAALTEKVGTTLADLIAFQGELDLSGLAIQDLTGLALLSGLTKVNLSGTSLTTVTAGILPGALKEIDLSNCTALTTVDLTGRPEVAVTVVGCTELLNLILPGTKMTSLNIADSVKLHNFNINGSEIAELVTAEASAYTNAYRWQLDGSKLDLTAETAEGALVAGIKAYFANTEIPVEIDTNPSALVNGGSWTARNNNNKVFTLSAAAELTTITFTNTYYNYGGTYSLKSAKIEVSLDGTDYTTALDFTDAGVDQNVTITLPVGTRAQYVRITQNGGNTAYMSNIRINGYAEAPIGFTYAGQQPAMVRDDIKTLTVLKDGQTYQVMDLLSDWYASARLVKSGTLALELTEADWIDQAYLNTQAVAPRGVKTEIFAPDGTKYEYPTEGPVLGSIETGSLTVQNVIASAQNSGEEGKNLFDDNPNTKWCTGSNGAWVGFELTEARVLGKWYTLHAGVESESMITSAFKIQTLDPEKVVEEDYLAMSESEKRTVLGNNANWKDLDVVTGNTANEVTREIELDNLTTAQVYRFQVNQYTQPGAQYGAVRVYGMALYAYEGQLGANVNGLLKADVAGEYHVDYLKQGVKLNETTVNVVTLEDRFEDVSNDAWYNDAVSFVVSNGLMVGTSETTFTPAAVMTRAQLAQVLYNMAGKPQGDYENIFADVSASAWYGPAVIWAGATGISTGNGRGSFMPNDTLTREQVAIFLASFARSQGVEIPAEGDLSAFQDADAVHTWGVPALSWAVENGIMQGSEGYLMPQKTATRAEVAVMLTAFCQNVG